METVLQVWFIKLISEYCYLGSNFRFRLDLAVGSFLSGHALVFRSRPVIQLKMMNRNENKIIDPEINGDSVEWKVCPSFESKYSIPEICKEIFTNQRTIFGICT